jgi:hypothetical protein
LGTTSSKIIITTEPRRNNARALYARLSTLARKLHVAVVELSVWPQWYRGVAGVYFSAGGHSRTSQKLLRKLLPGHHATPPIIVIHAGDPYTLAHELSHHASMFDVALDARAHRRVTPLLKRICERDHIRYYGKTQAMKLAELRASCIARLLLGEKLCPTLRRFVARAWAELERVL